MQDAEEVRRKSKCIIKGKESSQKYNGKKK